MQIMTNKQKNTQGMQMTDKKQNIKEHVDNDR